MTRGESSTGKTTQIRVNVGNPGSFNFYTNTVHGVQYTANNVDLAAGWHVVTLSANGNAPTASGTATFTVSGTGLNGASCSVIANIATNQATLTPNCGSALVNGIYKIDVPTTAANYIDIPITFATTGTWSATASSPTAAFTFTGEGNINSVGTHTVRLYASGIPAEAGAKDFEVSMNGVTCHLTVNVVMPPKYVLCIGGVSTYVRNALTNGANFGPGGKSQVETITILDGGNPYADANLLMNLINNNKIEVILAGWYFDCTNQVANVIADFIRNKKGFFFQIESQDQQPHLKMILDKSYGTNVSFTEDEFSILAARLPNVDNPFFNGVFGDIRGKYVRSDDYPSWIGLTPASVTGALGSLLQLPVRPGYAEPARNTFIHAPGFFMFPDWGMTNYVSPSLPYGTNSPIGYNANQFVNAYGTWNGTSYDASTTIPAGQIANWVFFGNVMDYAFKYVEDNINKTYQVDTDYSN